MWNRYMVILNFSSLVKSFWPRPFWLSFRSGGFIHVTAQIFKSGDLSNLIRSFDFISGDILSNYFNAR